MTEVASELWNIFDSRRVKAPELKGLDAIVNGVIGVAKGQLQIEHARALRGVSHDIIRTAAHQHGASEPSHEKMQSADASGHKHEMTTSGQATEKTSMPETIEGVWKAIHEQHGELEASVNARQFKEVQSPATMLRDLAKRLAELTRPEQKPGVESGVGKITRALAELKSSAETGSDTVMKIRFKVFAAALAELEPQMKKQ